MSTLITTADGLVINSEIPEAQARLLNGYGAKIVSVNAAEAKKAARMRQYKANAKARAKALAEARAAKVAERK